MEAHLVHADKDGNLAVVALMFAEGAKDNAGLEQFWSQMPAKAEETTALTARLTFPNCCQPIMITTVSTAPYHTTVYRRGRLVGHETARHCFQSTDREVHPDHGASEQPSGTGGECTPCVEVIFAQLLAGHPWGGLPMHHPSPRSVTYC